MPRSFASDNSAGVHPDVLQAIHEANVGHVPAYGDDPYTERAQAAFRRQFGEDVRVFFVYGGTGANVLGLKAVTESYHAVLCAESAHINIDECGAPERHLGCKLIAIPTADGKLRPADVQPHLKGFGVPHHAQPKVISITQTTELGTVYQPREIQALADLAHQNGMVLHMDGARISNAAASLELGLAAITGDVGVDVLSFGGTKSGLMFGEAVVFFSADEALERVPYLRKQSMQLASKMRFVGAQFQALLTDDLWRRNAEHANRMARLLAQTVEVIDGVELTQPVESNAVFARIPSTAIPPLQKRWFFYVWDAARAEVRWMTAFDTTEEDVGAFASAIREELGRIP
ncbi:MAG: low specificity L-threonine aldolase [Gemmatimonadales bacterium]